jgi:hypothetical protein
MNAPDPALTGQVWDSLKIPILIVAVLGPVIIVILAIRFSRFKKRLIGQYQSNQKLIEKRIEVYERIGPKLNDLLGFFCYTGDWKDFTPMDIMRLKRELDKEITINTPLFSDDLHERYDAFVRLCFVAHAGWEHQEKIKSQYAMRKEHMPEWNEEWVPFFDTNNVVEGIKMKERYDELMEYFKKEVNIGAVSSE